MSTSLLPTIEIESAPNPTAAVIVLHGLGADGNDFVPVVEELTLPPQLATRFIFPHAPIRRVTINGGYPMRAWYDILEGDLSRRADLEGVRASQKQINALIEHEVTRGISSTRIVVAGFSQGGAIALYAGLRYPHPLAGVIGLSTYLIDGPALRDEGAATNIATPIFMAHGMQDTVVRLEWADASRRLLTELGYAVEWHTYPMPHAVAAQEIDAISRYLTRVLKS